MTTRAQIDAIVTKIQGSRDLSPGGIAALKELAYALNDELTTLSANYAILLQLASDLQQARVIVYQSSPIFNNSLIAQDAGGLTITQNAPTEVDIEFSA